MGQRQALVKSIFLYTYADWTIGDVKTISDSTNDPNLQSNQWKIYSFAMLLDVPTTSFEIWTTNLGAFGDSLIMKNPNINFVMLQITLILMILMCISPQLLTLSLSHFYLIITIYLYRQSKIRWNRLLLGIIYVWTCYWFDSL